MAATEQELQVQIQARMLEALNSREQEFSTLTSLLADIVFRCDRDGKILLLNSAWEEVLGWKVEECLGSNLTDYQSANGWCPDPQVSDAFASEVSFITRDGATRAFNLKATYSAGSWYGSMTDVTEYHRAQAELELARERERKLSLVASRTDNLVVISDAQGTIEWVNESFERETGYCFEIAVGKRPSELLQGPETSQDTVAVMREGLRAGTGFNVEVVNYNKDGDAYWVEVDCTPVVDERGELVNFIAVERIITERKESELLLRDSEQHFRTILDTVSEAIFHCDTALTIQYVNPAWSGMTGHELTPGERVNLSDFVHCDDMELLERMCADIRKHSEQVRQELRVISREGGWRHVEVILSNSQLDSKLAITGALIDIDERWHANKAILQAKERAEQLSHARTQFVANMSHEIRTPLNAIIGMSNVLRNTQLDNDQSSYVDTLLNGGNALLALVNDILDLAKLDAGEMELENRPFDLLELAEQCIDVMANSAQEKNLGLSLRVGSGLSRNHTGDAHRIRQILFNLLSNAIKFTEQGSVSLYLDQERMGDGTLLKIRVEDTGIGIERQKLNTLFDAFTQADPSITRQFGGTGLGLAISKQIVDQMGGRIWAESSPGNGTVFHCELPTYAMPGESLGSTLHAYNLTPSQLDEVSAAAAVAGYTFCSHQDAGDVGLALQHRGGVITARNNLPNDTIRSPRRLLASVRLRFEGGSEVTGRNQAKTQKILLAEDVIPNQLVAKAMLKQLGYTNVTVVENGLRAVECAREEQFDIALLDIHMPVMDGITAAEHLRRENLIPVIIAASADVTTEARSRTEAVGFDDMLPKPFTRESLADMLNRYCHPQVFPAAG